MASSLLNFPGLARRSAEFGDKLRVVADTLEVDPNWLLAVMQRESGIDPKAENKRSGATGLIQFMPTTATRLGTTVAKLRRMTDVDQLDKVLAFYKPWIGKLKTAGDLYLATFWPVAVGADDESYIAFRGDAVYEANKPLDDNNDGVITAGDIRAVIERELRKYAGTVFTEPKFRIPPRSAGKAVLLIVGVGVVVFATSRIFKAYL